MIILGDLLFTDIKQNFQILCKNFKLFHLDQIIAEPTRIAPNTSRLLDHILCNNKEKMCQSGTILIDQSEY